VPLTPGTIRRIAVEIVKEHALPFDVVAAWRSLRKSPYIEIVLNSLSGSGPERVSVGVTDWMSESQIRQELVAQLHARQ
jgi:hypothetical protein